jgi:hypothetical protein
MELGKTVPVHQIEEKLEDTCIVGFRQKAIENRYSALLNEELSVS